MARAIAMPLDERRKRHAELYEALLRNDIADWGDRFLAALMPPDGGPDEETLNAFIGANTKKEA